MFHHPQRRYGKILAILLAAGIALGSLIAPEDAHAQYPSKPIRLVVPSSPGGAPDTIARALGKMLSPLLGQTVVVENRTGANGNIATELVAKSVPDGYTLMIAPDSTIVINPHLYAKMPVDTLKDLVPVAPLFLENPMFLAVHPSLPVKSFQEFVEYAKAANPPLAYASGGNGSQHHMAMEMLKLRADINLVHIPYKGGGAAVPAVLAGEVPAMFNGGITIGNHIRTGRLRALAATGNRRSAWFPNLPTVGEFFPGYHLATWMGIFAPAGLPDAVMARLRAEINKVIAMPGLKAHLGESDVEPNATTPEEFIAVIRSDYEKYGTLVKHIGAQVDH